MLKFRIDRYITGDLSTIRTASDLSTIQFRLIFKGHKSLEYWCLVLHLTSVSTISYAESSGVAFFLKYKSSAAERNKLAIGEGCCFHVEIPCKIVQFSEFSSKMQDYLWIIWVKIGRSLMDNGGTN